MGWHRTSYFFIEGALVATYTRKFLHNKPVITHLLDRLDETGITQRFQDDGASRPKPTISSISVLKKELTDPFGLQIV